MKLSKLSLLEFKAVLATRDASPFTSESSPTVLLLLLHDARSISAPAESSIASKLAMLVLDLGWILPLDDDEE